MPAGNCNGDSTCRDDFYSDPVAVGYYKDHVKTILNRVNSFNQRLYRSAQPPVTAMALMRLPQAE